MLSCLGKTTPSKKFQTISAKVDEYYNKFHSINFEMKEMAAKEITEHTIVIPNQRRRRIINDFKLIQQQTSCIIETT